jgi:hypothetical protein
MNCVVGFDFLGACRSMHRMYSTRNMAFRCRLGLVCLRKEDLKNASFASFGLRTRSLKRWILRSGSLRRWDDVVKLAVLLGIAMMPILPNVIHACICLELRNARIAGQSFTCAFQRKARRFAVARLRFRREEVGEVVASLEKVSATCWSFSINLGHAQSEKLLDSRAERHRFEG